MENKIKFNMPAIDKRSLAKGATKVGLIVVNSMAMAPGVMLLKAIGKKPLTALGYLGSVSIATYVSEKEAEITDKLIDRAFDGLEERKERMKAAKYAEVHFPEEESIEAPTE